MIMTRFNLPNLRRKTRPPSPRLQRRSLYDVQTYTPNDKQILKSANHFFFPSRKSTLLKTLTDTTTASTPSLHNVHGLNTKKDLLSFDIYPTCHHALSINKILHDAAWTGSFDADRLENVLGVHILVLGLPPELHQFLSTTPRKQVDTAIVDFLVLLRHQLETEGDVEGVRRLEEDLEPTVSERLHESIGKCPDGEPPAGRRANVLEQIVQLAFLTPWRVDIWGAYITPPELLDLRSGSFLSGDAAVAKLLKDWIVFSDVLHGVAPDWGIADGLERAICEGKSSEIFSKAKSVSRLIDDVNSVLHGLPRDVVEGYLIPWLVRNECESLPSRRRVTAPLECTPAGVKFLDELEAAGEELIDRLAIDRDGLDLWREWAAAHGSGTQEKQDLCFPLDEKPWGGSGRYVNVTLDNKHQGHSLWSGREEPELENASLDRSSISNRRSLSDRINMD